MHAAAALWGSPPEGRRGMSRAQHGSPNSQALPHPAHLYAQRTCLGVDLRAERQQQLLI